MTFHSPLLRDLAFRGFLKDCTDFQQLDALLSSRRKIAVYAGFDPTADSLHVGHLVSLTLLRRFKDAGHTVIPLIGTATALVGDPSGRSSARPMLDANHVEANADGVEASIRRAIGDDGDVRIRRNGAWFQGVGWIDFLRDVGRLMPLSRMLALESVRSRVSDGGISFLEFSYSLMQAYDFLMLSREHPILLQVGGSDQWGNICMGIELIGKRESNGAASLAFGLTHPLLLKSNGEKMGKSAGNAVWLNPGRMDDFSFFQFLRNLNDEDLPGIVPLLSDQVVEGQAERLGGDVAALNQLKEAFAMELTARIRGPAAAEAARSASQGRGRSAKGVPECPVASEDLVDLAGVMVRAGLATSKSAARRLSVQGGIKLNGIRCDRMALDHRDFLEGVAVLSAGKTRHIALRLTG